MEKVLKKFRSKSLKDISCVSFLNRIDSKYLMNREELSDFLEKIEQEYSVVEIDEERIQPYRTQYYDSEQLHFYNKHQSGKRARFKFRTREYVRSGTVFDEVKEKVNTGKTFKSRINRSCFTETFDETFRRFAASKCEVLPTGMIPQLLVLYNRITLVNNALTERMTIDLDLSFSHANRKSSFPNLAIVELKRDRVNRDSFCQTVMRELRLRPVGFSKYCIGIATTRDTVRKNNIKIKLRQVEKICCKKRSA